MGHIAVKALLRKELRTTQPGSEFQFLGRPALILVAILTGQSRLPYKYTIHNRFTKLKGRWQFRSRLL
jgi:hypothetical protein